MLACNSMHTLVTLISFYYSDKIFSILKSENTLYLLRRLISSSGVVTAPIL